LLYLNLPIAGAEVSVVRNYSPVTPASPNMSFGDMNLGDSSADEVELEYFPNADGIDPDELGQVLEVKPSDLEEELGR
jgi:hypothetical protein